jgi:hypothetical protein
VWKLGLSMRASILRFLTCAVLLIVVPRSLLAQTADQQPTGAILRAQGGVWVNGLEARDGLAIFPGDSIETKVGFSANLTVEGSTILIAPESLAKFGDNFLTLEHGTVSVGTSRKFRVHVNCIRVVPVLAEWTQYGVADLSRTIQVAARKDDVNVERDGVRRKTSKDDQPTESASVHESEQHDYNETDLCGAAAGPIQAAALNMKWIEIGSGAGAAIILCAILCRGGGGKTPMSASAP